LNNNLKIKLSEISEIVGGKLVGDSNVIISSLAKIDEADEGDLTFLYLSSYEKFFDSTHASAIFVKPEFKKTRSDISYIEVKEPEKKVEEQPAAVEGKKVSDEPYIKTILCTSCNECININSMMFAYNEDKQAEIKDVTKGTFKQLVMAAEKCPAAIIHPGKPKNPDEKDLDKLLKRAEKFN